MRLRNSLTLLMVGGAALLGVNYLMHLQAPPMVPLDQLMFPKIAARLAEASRVEISSFGKKATLVLRDGVWGVEERDLYPAEISKLRALLTGLGELRLIEPRTSDPAQFSKLGVEDPPAAGSTATLLRVRDAKGTALAEAILGHRRSRPGNLPEEVFVRRPGTDQSFMAEGQVMAEADPVAWLDRTLADVPSGHIATIVVRRDGNEVQLARQGDTLVLKPQEGAKTDPARLAETFRALESLTFLDVRRGLLPGMPIGSAIFTVTGGPELTVGLSREDKTVWASFAAVGSGAEAYRRLDAWSFEIPELKERTLLPTLADLAPPPEPAKAEAPAPEAALSEVPR